MRKTKLRLRFQIIAFTVARLVLNTGHRMVYPFLPTFARGLNVSQETVALAVTARSSLGLAGPVYGTLADARGRKLAMMTGMASFGLGMLLVLLWPTYPALFAGLLLGGIGKSLYDPAMQAYIGDRVHYTRRGTALAMTELSWSGAFLLGMPLIGWLIARSDYWQAPFPLLAALALGSVGVLWLAVPSDAPQPGERPRFSDGLRVVARHPVALAGISVGFLISGANEVISIVYGAWMEDAFALKVTALGATSIVIGIAELTSEGAVAGMVDRLGKRRAVVLGIGSNAAASLLLPLTGFSVGGAMVGLFVFFLTFEFAMVSLIPLLTELVPQARATVMAGSSAAMAAGRMVGALVGTYLFRLGLVANGGTAALMNVVALVVILWFIKQE